jgi:hypothetical protein
MWLEIARNVSEHPVPVKSLSEALHRFKSEVLMLAGFMGIMNRKIPRMAPAAASHLHCFLCAPYIAYRICEFLS